MVAVHRMSPLIYVFLKLARAGPGALTLAFGRVLLLLLLLRLLSFDLDLRLPRDLRAGAAAAPFFFFQVFAARFIASLYVIPPFEYTLFT